MNLGKVLERFDTREQRMLRALGLVFVIVAVLAIGFGSHYVVSESRDKVEALRNAISEITSSQASIAKADQRRQIVTQRYARVAPPLAALLDGLAKESGIEIPESQDRPLVPHGKRYEERAIRLQLRKVALGNLARFLEKIEQPSYALVLSKLNIRKRLTEPDSYDVELIASAYDRKELPKGEAGGEGGKGDSDKSNSADKAGSEKGKESQ